MVTRAYDKWFWKEIEQEGNFKGAGYTMYFRQIGPRGPSVRPEKDESWAPGPNCPGPNLSSTML